MVCSMTRRACACWAGGDGEPKTRPHRLGEFVAVPRGDPLEHLQHVVQILAPAVLVQHLHLDLRQHALGKHIVDR